MDEQEVSSKIEEILSAHFGQENLRYVLTVQADSPCNEPGHGEDCVETTEAILSNLTDEGILVALGQSLQGFHASIHPDCAAEASHGPSPESFAAIRSALQRAGATEYAELSATSPSYAEAKAEVETRIKAALDAAGIRYTVEEAPEGIPALGIRIDGDTDPAKVARILRDLAESNGSPDNGWPGQYL
jgi:hypothetical protein